MVSSPPPVDLLTPLTAVRGVGSERAAQLARLGLRTVGELMLHRPRRYEDRRHFQPIAHWRPGEAAVTRGRIVAQGLKRFKRGTQSVFEFILEDGSARLHCRWWNLPFMENYFRVGDEVFVFGRLKSLKPPTIDHPETEVIVAGDEESLHLNRIVPVYPLTEGLPQRWLRTLLARTLTAHAAQIAEPHPGLARAELPTRADAVRQLHFPAELADAEAGRRRLALDEFIELQLAIQTRRRNLYANARGLPCGGDNRFIKPFLAGLGFTLTPAQTTVLRELRRELAGGRPMRRLLQGDVGSGKTVVAGCCALMALESGFSVVLMAPTEILAAQHFQNFSRWLAPLALPVELRTGSRKTGAAGRAPKNQVATTPAAAPTLFIGTHALLEPAAAMEHLGLVIIDEQHKFGVAQRETLLRKGRYPHLLVMTATPIPRTLGLTLYGDLDVSVIDQLPAGRGVTRTFVRTADKLPQVWAFVREQLRAGRQAYVVYPRVEDGGPGEVKAVLKEAERLRQLLAPQRVELLHGRLPADEKERVMAGFRRGEIPVLLATSIIEVGVDVPNATVMVIENAEQFGLAQLHQLRGRIGRGAGEAYCILIADAPTEDARARLQVLTETHDGFEIAEADLRLRGPGELLGQSQSGLPPFRFGDLAGDRALIERARELAAALLARPATAPGAGAH